MAYVPVFALYASNGSSLVYTFTYTQNINEPNDPYDSVQIDGLRGIGSLIIPGSAQSWEMVIDFIIEGTDYEDLMSKVDSINSTIVPFTPYVFKAGRTSSTSASYNVKRIRPIEQTNTQEGRRMRFAKMRIYLQVNTW